MSNADGLGAVVWRATGGMDAIDDHGRRLVAALEDCGVHVRYHRAGLGPVLSQSSPPAWVLLQYNPFRYGRWGFAPRLVNHAIRLRRLGVPMAMMVHEAWVDMANPKSTLIGLWQRVQLRGLMRFADRVLASTQALARELGHDAIHTPVGSNVSPVTVSPEVARSQLGLPDQLVVATFGRAHESRALDFAAAAIAAIASSRPTTVLNLGADAPRLDIPAELDVRNVAEVSEHDLSVHLRASDLVLLPFVDGVSTRRTTLMAALAHGRPVVGLRGHNTDDVLAARNEALVLSPVGDLRAYVEAALSLSADPERRRAIGGAARELYEREFDWPVTAARAIAVLEEIAPRSVASREVVAAR